MPTLKSVPVGWVLSHLGRRNRENVLPIRRDSDSVSTNVQLQAEVPGESAGMSSMGECARSRCADRKYDE